MNNIIIWIWFTKKFNSKQKSYPRPFILHDITLLQNNKVSLNLLNISSQKKGFFPQNVTFQSKCEMLNTKKNESIIKTDNVAIINEVSKDIELFIFNNCSCDHGCVSDETFYEMKQTFEESKINKKMKLVFDTYHEVSAKNTDEFNAIINWSENFKIDHKFINNPNKIWEKIEFMIDSKKMI